MFARLPDLQRFVFHFSYGRDLERQAPDGSERTPPIYQEAESSSGADGAFHSGVAGTPGT